MYYERDGILFRNSTHDRKASKHMQNGLGPYGNNIFCNT